MVVAAELAARSLAFATCGAHFLGPSGAGLADQEKVLPWHCSTCAEVAGDCRKGKSPNCHQHHLERIVIVLRGCESHNHKICGSVAPQKLRRCRKMRSMAVDDIDREWF